MAGTFLVIGGTGRTGRHVVAELVCRGHHVRVLSRSGTALGNGIEVRRGDITNEAQIRSAMDSVAGVVLTVESAESAAGPNGPEHVHYDGIRHVLAAATSEVQVVVVTQIYITRPERFPEMGAIIYWRGRAEAAVRASGIPYTIVRPSWLTADPGGHAALRLEQGDRGDGRVSRADVAMACVEALFSADARGKTFELYGEPCIAPASAAWPALFAALTPDAALPKEESL